MKIEVNIQKKYFFALLTVFIVLGIVSIAIASHNSGTPNPGHDVNEIGGLPTCSSGEVLTHDSSGLRCVGVSGSGGGGSIEVAQAYRLDGPSDNRPIITVQGDSGAFVAVDDVASHSGSSSQYMDGVQCDKAGGWKVSGCWVRTGDQDADISPYDNGCVTNDFDQRSGVELSITCMKGGSGGAGSCVECSWTGWACVDSEDITPDWHGRCEDGCLAEVRNEACA